ncbi:hypothetical protein [Croceibacter atlanticus]|jgi:hypothetical protein|uniref:Uncharacterized protein n=1 Tax=Croceibacter atlanticus (strain ATCC BAA-628 / JCM 21780 / CIP 108009 / IAM 15332 / KCTC 12090 / HTCC2559) TaxID=216432 RepID=A3U4I3_CROAH|nr:hypothetical protein [Croceibacter atlanticus]EAP87150.1 hypothetical protein CA2559_00305 [Croceibacter atlanticus HTCC2559]
MNKKLKWTLRMALTSFSLLVFALLINYFREPLLGIKEGYAPHNFSFNFLFFLPAILTSLGLGIAVIGRTIKHWKNWNSLNRKLIFIGLSSPVILLFIFQTIRILTIE